MIIGWFSNFFDMPYLIKRLEVNNIPTSKLSLINKNVRLFKKHNNNDWIINIPGIYSIELNKMIERYISDKFSSMSLNNVSKQLGIGEKNEINLSIDYKYNFYKFMKYNIQDVRLTKKIDEIYNITGLMIYLHNLTGVAFDKILSTSNIVKSAIIKYSKEIVVDRKLKFKNYQGAIVLTPKYQGILKNVCTLDANSMYPTSIITFNISPDTYITSYDEIERNKENIIEFIKNKISIIVKKELKLPNILTSNISPLQYILKTLKFNNIDYIDTGYSNELNEHGYIFMHHNYKIGIFAQYLKEVYDERVKIKNKMKKYKTNTLQYKKYNAINNALKLILVSTYGANGYAQFFLYDPRIAETITYFARKLLTYGIKFLNEIQYEIQYGDTDSLFVLLHTKEDDYNKCLNEANKINIEINSNIYKYHTSNYISTKLPLKYNNYLGFKLEHILHYIYFSDSKKRYFGIEYPDENGKEQPYVRGMNVIRKDAPKIIKQILNELVYKILKENITKNDFNDILDKVKSADLKEIGIIKSFNKKFTNYKVLPQHVKAARFANEVFNVRISNFDHPYMFYIKLKHTNKKYKYYDGVIALNQDDLKLLKNNNIIEIDYDKLIEKQILDQLKEFKYVKGLEDIISVLRYKNKHSKYISLFDF